MYIIVGIDPGKSVGIACLDLNGNLIMASHMSNVGMGWVTNAINGVGTPAIIAGDKPEAGALVRKINAHFNSRLFLPAREFKIEEKRMAAKRAGIKNPHERDAYVAAISAYHAFANKFKQIERKAALERYANPEQIKAKVISKYSVKEAAEGKKANRK